MDQVGAIVLGAVLAVATSVVADEVRAFRNQRRARTVFLTLLGIELPLIIATLGELADDYGKVGYYPLGTIARLQAQRGGYDRNQNGIVLLAPALRVELVTVYQRLAAVTADLAGAEQLLLQKPEYKDTVERKRAELVGTVRDVAQRGRELLRQLT